MGQEGHTEVEGRQRSHEGTKMKRGSGGRERNPLFDYALGSGIDDICRTNFFVLYFIKKKKKSRPGMNFERKRKKREKRQKPE